MGSHDIENIKKREDRKRRHNQRANEERAAMFKHYEENITLISWLPLEAGEACDEYLVRFKLNKVMPHEDFLHKLIESIGDWINV